MKRLPEGKDLYILPFLGHTHLCFFMKENVRTVCGYKLAAKINCSPRIEIPITTEMIEKRDRQYSDVDCPNCLEALN